MSFDLDYAKLRAFATRLAEKSRAPITTSAFEGTISSYVAILATINQHRDEVQVPGGTIERLMRDFRRAGGRISDASGTQLQLISGGRKSPRIYKTSTRKSA